MRNREEVLEEYGCDVGALADVIVAMEQEINGRNHLSGNSATELKDKESIVELMFSVQTGHTSCRRAASDLQAKFQEIERENARLREGLQRIASWNGGLGVKWPMEMAADILSNIQGQESPTTTN